MEKPKWNRFQDSKNKATHIYCSEEMVNKLDVIDQGFVYPLIGHRSHLIHTEHDIGDFTLNFNLSGGRYKVNFYATDLFLNSFPEIKETDTRITIKYSAMWLIEKTISTTTDILFELKDDLIRNKKQEFGLFLMIGDNGSVQSPSTDYWGDKDKS